MNISKKSTLVSNTLSLHSMLMPLTHIAGRLMTVMSRSRKRKATWGIRKPSNDLARQRTMPTMVSVLVVGWLTLTPILMGGGAVNSGMLLPEVYAEGSLQQRQNPAVASNTHPQDDQPITLSRGFKPFSVEDSIVFGGIPKDIFSTHVLYNVGPTFSRAKALVHDGLQFNEPVKMREWRQIIFELSMNKLNAAVLPDYIAYLTKARGHRWDKASVNGEPILIADVDFEWLADALETNPELARQPDGSYTLHGTSRSLTTNKNTFFSASLLSDTLHSRLVTFVLNEELLYSNRDDRIVSVDLLIDNNRLSIPMNGSRVVDLGDQEGDRTVYLTAHRRSGQQSKACYKFVLLKANGKWVNNKLNSGKLSFAEEQLPTITFTQKDNQR